MHAISSSPDYIKQVYSNNRYSNKISWKRKEAFQLSQAIQDYLKQFDVSLPRYYKDFCATRQEVLLYDHYDNALDKEMGELVKLHYDLKTCNKGIYAVFNNNQCISTQLLACWYSKNRLDPVWNYRKSMLIRKAWYEYLKQSTIHEQYLPIHLVLTVPHKDGVWRNDRFYARQLISAYNWLRKEKKFKEFIYGGEYGLECKKSTTGNGFHIHIHSLLFQRPEYSINEVREWIVKRWKTLTGNESGYSGIHYEQLYCYKRDESGQYISQEREVITGTTEVEDHLGAFAYEPLLEQKKVRKKFRVGPGSSLEDYLSGVMECIKYHFKPGCLKKEDNTFDFDLIRSILNNTKNLRMYSRFGALYKEKKLDFTRLEKPVQEQTDLELDEEVVMATLDTVIYRLVNPLTMKPARLSEFRMAISCPEFLSHRPKDYIKPCEPIINCMDAFYFLDEKLSLKEAMSLLAKGNYRKMLDYDNYMRFKTFLEPS
jgi:hypothetical protein